jgi:peptidoglycan hydrolase-like protein with peptidoglycan-binding domain
MKKSVFIILGLVLAIGITTGCRKKQPTLEEMQEPMSMEALSKMSAEAPGMVEPKTQPTQNIEPLAASSTPTTAESVVPTTPAKPTNEEIQTALKNAGLYTGNIDGKIGPMTRKAIEDFQKANNLKVDGKVGPKTWALLGAYLNPQPAETKSKKKR